AGRRPSARRPSRGGQSRGPGTARRVTTAPAAPTHQRAQAPPGRQEEAALAVTAGKEAPAAAVAGLIKALVRDVPDYPQPGILFKDITPLLADADAFDQVVDALAAGHGPVGKVAGIEARGFIL